MAVDRIPRVETRQRTLADPVPKIPPQEENKTTKKIFAQVSNIPS